MIKRKLVIAVLVGSAVYLMATRAYKQPFNPLYLALSIAGYAALSIGLGLIRLSIEKALRKRKYLRSQEEMGNHLYEVSTSQEIQERFELYAENRPDIKLCEDEVPTDLRCLVTLAEKWGVSDDIIRSDMENKATPREKVELRDAVRGKVEAINAWLDTEPSGNMSEEAAAFMYMMEAYEEWAVVEQE
jgi:hypothetical protein